MRQAEFSLRVVRYCFLGDLPFLPLLKIDSAQNEWNNLTDRKTHTHKKTKKKKKKKKHSVCLVKRIFFSCCLFVLENIQIELRNFLIRISLLNKWQRLFSLPFMFIRKYLQVSRICIFVYMSFQLIRIQMLLCNCCSIYKVPLNIKFNPTVHQNIMVVNNIKSEMRSFKSNENIHKKEGGSYYVVSANKASSVTL